MTMHISGHAPRILLLALLLLWGPGCRDSLDTVLPERLEPGGGAMAVSAQPQLDIVIRMTGDATDFNIFDLMQVIVNGTDVARDETMVIGGDYAVYTVPNPGVASFAVTLNRRVGTYVDDTEWLTQPYTGPTITGVAPDTAMVGAQVVISGTGFDAGPLSVYFGGVEGTVDSFTATSITATVPADAHPGLVWVRVGSLSANGVIGFRPQDATGADLPLPTQIHINQLFPGSSAPEQVIRVYGFNFDNDAFAEFAGEAASRILNVTTINVPPVGEMRMAFAVPNNSTPSGLIDFKLQDDGNETNKLPYTIEE